MKSQPIDPKMFLEDFTKDIVSDAEHRLQTIRGYTKHMNARDAALKYEEVKMAIETFKEDPENFLEIAESRLIELINIGDKKENE